MDYDEDDYIEEDESLKAYDDLEDEEDSDYEDSSADYGDGDFSYNQNSFNSNSFNHSDIENIRQRINNGRNANSNQNTTNQGTIPNSGTTLEKKDGLSEPKTSNLMSDAANATSNEAQKATAKKVTENVTENVAEKTAEKAAEKTAEKAVEETVAKEAGLGLKIKIILWASLILLIILVIIGVIAAVAFSITYFISGADENDLKNLSINQDSYTDISNPKYYWPIGSKETTEINGVVFATGNPVSTKITSEYGSRVHPISGVKKKHNGIDIGEVGAVGTTNVIAVQSGVVIKTVNSCKSYGNKSCGGGYGNYIMISHSDGKYTLYAHLHENTLMVKKNDVVKQGQVIAKVGSSGNSTGPHLHFEVRTNAKNRTNPLNFVDTKNPRLSSQFDMLLGKEDTILSNRVISENSSLATLDTKTIVIQLSSLYIKK